MFPNSGPEERAMARALDTGPNQSGGERLTLHDWLQQKPSDKAMFQEGGPGTQKKAPQCGTGLPAGKQCILGGGGVRSLPDDAPTRPIDLGSTPSSDAGTSC